MKFHLFLVILLLVIQRWIKESNYYKKNRNLTYLGTDPSFLKNIQVYYHF